MNDVVKYEKPDLPVVGNASREAALLVVDDQTTYDLVSEQAASYKARGDAIEAKRVEYKKPIDNLAAMIQRDFVPPRDDLYAAFRICKDKMAAYFLLQETKRIEAQRIADASAAAERAKLEKAAEKAAAKGDVDKAATLAATASVITAAAVGPAVEQPKGSSTARPWKARVDNKVEALAYIGAHIAEHPEWVDLLDFKQSKLDGLAKAMQASFPIKGIVAFQDVQMSVRKAETVF